NSCSSPRAARDHERACRPRTFRERSASEILAHAGKRSLSAQQQDRNARRIFRNGEHSSSAGLAAFERSGENRRATDSVESGSNRPGIFFRSRRKHYSNELPGGSDPRPVSRSRKKARASARA